MEDKPLILKNKNKGRNFESNIRNYLKPHCYVFTKGVSTKGIDIIALYKIQDKEHIAFLLELKNTTLDPKKLLQGEVLRKIKENFKKEIVEFLTKTDIFPLPFLLIKKNAKVFLFIYDFKTDNLLQFQNVFKNSLDAIRFILDLEVMNNIIEFLVDRKKNFVFEETF